MFLSHENENLRLGDELEMNLKIKNLILIGKERLRADEINPTHQSVELKIRYPIPHLP